MYSKIWISAQYLQGYSLLTNKLFGIVSCREEWTKECMYEWDHLGEEFQALHVRGEAQLHHSIGDCGSQNICDLDAYLLRP